LRDVKDILNRNGWRALANGNFVEELFKAAVEEDVLICKIAWILSLNF
jgi:hypothetical protein